MILDVTQQILLCLTQYCHSIYLYNGFSFCSAPLLTAKHLGRRIFCSSREHCSECRSTSILAPFDEFLVAQLLIQSDSASFCLLIACYSKNRKHA